MSRYVDVLRFLLVFGLALAMMFQIIPAEHWGMVGFLGALALLLMSTESLRRSRRRMSKWD